MDVKFFNRSLLVSMVYIIILITVLFTVWDEWGGVYFTEFVFLVLAIWGASVIPLFIVSFMPAMGRYKIKIKICKIKDSDKENSHD